MLLNTVAPSRERGSKQHLQAARQGGLDVAPSRERGSKRPRPGATGCAPESLPHGSADRNQYFWVNAKEDQVAPSRERGSKLRIEDDSVPSTRVAPSRERGSKQGIATARARERCRSLTGARIETCRLSRLGMNASSLPHGSADRNLLLAGIADHGGCRSLTGARIETGTSQMVPDFQSVAPSRERGSKLKLVSQEEVAEAVAPSRERGSKPTCRPSSPTTTAVAPSRERGSKPGEHRRTEALPGSLPHGRAGSKPLVFDPGHWRRGSLPHGSADRNMPLRATLLRCLSRSLTGARIETTRRTPPPRRAWRSLPHGSADRNVTEMQGAGAGLRSLPHGSADRNTFAASGLLVAGGRSLTGARIETDASSPIRRATGVAPSRERGSKHRETAGRRIRATSLPHGSADRNRDGDVRAEPRHGRSLTGARIETAPWSRCRTASPVAPSRERGSKHREIPAEQVRPRRSLTGARIETL